MAVTNFLKDLRETIWEILEDTPEIVDLVGGKFLKRPITIDDIDPGQCPFLSGWFLSPARNWWTSQADRYDIEFTFFGALQSADREDFNDVETLLIAINEALRTDLVAGASRLRQQGRVIVFVIEGSEIGYFEDLESEEGASYVEISSRFTLQNPNAGGSP